MEKKEPFKLGELSTFELPSVSQKKSRTSNRTGNDFNAQLKSIIAEKPSSSTPFVPSNNNDKGDFSKSFDSAIEGLKATGKGALAAGATALGFDEFADEQIKSSEKNQRKADRLAHGLITDIADVDLDKGVVEGVSDLGNYLINGAGTLAPSVLETVAAGVAGAAVGSALPGAGTLAGGVLGGLAKITGKKKLQSLVKEYVATKGFKDIAGQTAKQVALNKRKKKIVDDAISKFYQTAGVLASGQTLGTGEIFNEALQAGATKDEAAQTGLIGGVPFALLDSVLPGSIIKNIGKNFSGGRIKNATREAVESFVKEGATETAQEEILIRTKANFDKDFDVNGPEATSRRLNSFILGGFGGAALGGVSGALQKKVDTKELRTPLTNIDFNNKEVQSSYSRLLSFINTNERFTSLIDTDTDQDTVNRILDTSVANVESLKKNLADKFLSEDNKDITSRSEAEEVIRVIDSHLDSVELAKSQLSEVKDNDAKLKKAQESALDQSNINPEFKHIDGIRERVLGISQGLSIDLNKTELKALTKAVQDRLFKLPDQGVPADEAISDLKILIQEDIRTIERGRGTTSSFDQVASKQTTARKVADDKKKGSKNRETTSDQELVDAVVNSQSGINTKSANTIKEQLQSIVDEKKVKAADTKATITPEILEVIPTASEAKITAEKQILPRSGSPSKSIKTRTITKRARKTSEVLDVSDEGLIDISTLLDENLPTPLRSLPDSQKKGLRVKVNSVNGDILNVTTEITANGSSTFDINSVSFISTPSEPTLQDKAVNQIELSDLIKESNTVTNKPKKIINRAKPKNSSVKAELPNEIKTLSEKLSRGKITPEEVARLDELESQKINNIEDVVSETTIDLQDDISEDEILLQDRLSALDKEIELDRKEDSRTSLSSDQLSRIDSIDQEISQLQEVLSILDPELDLEERNNIQEEISLLHSEKVSLRGFSLTENSNQRHIKEKKINRDLDIPEGSTIDEAPLDFQDVIITDEPDSFSIASEPSVKIVPTPPTKSETLEINKLIDRVKSGLKSNVLSNVKIIAVSNYKDFVNQRKSDGISDKSIGTEQHFRIWNALAARNPDGTHTVFINTTQSQMKIPEFVAGTLMHELVGHIGLNKVFGEKLVNFNLSLLKSNPALRNDILSLSTRWKGYNESWLRVNPNFKLNDSNSFKFKNPIDGKVIRIHSSVAARLSEEYLAELAAIKLTNKDFKVKNNLRQGFINRVLKRLSHLTRSLFGKFNSGINEEDLLSAIAASADSLFVDPDNFLFDDLRVKVLNSQAELRSSGLKLDPRGKLRVQRNLEKGIIDTVKVPDRLTELERAYLDTVGEVEFAMEPADMVEGKSAANVMGANAVITEGVQKALNNNYGKLNESAHVAFFNNIGRAVKNNPMAQKFFALGNLPYEKLYNSIQAVTKGKLGKLETLSRTVNKQLNTLSAFQKSQVYKFFTTRFDENQTNVEIQQLRLDGISEPIIGTILNAKGTIESLGQQLVDLNMLNPESFEENRGSYLPTRYLKYLFTNPGGGKKTSLLNFLKKDSNLDEDTKAMLGEIKDPAFLVSETIGMIGRDTTLLQMLDSLAENGRTGSTSWVLNSEDFVKFRGKSRSQAWLQSEIARVEVILADHLSDTSGAFQLTGSQLDFNRQLLADMQESESKAETAILERMSKESKENGQGDIDPATYRSQHYKQMKKGRRYGKLSGLWVRKEIVNDLDGVLQSFDIDPDDPIAKWFGGNGKLVKANSYWKMLKVPFNVPSWFRNGVGNLTLLDISTNTSMPKLTKMFHEEVTNAIQGNESKFWLLAVDNGLFGTTYAASELYGLRRDFDKRMKTAGLNQEIIKGSKVKGMFEFMNDQFLTASDFASRGFGYLEGSFKAVAMRDFIQQWEAQNNTKLDNVESDSRQAVILEAVAHANNALFDYSQVPPLVNFARRYPLGAPFITFMYKSFPVVLTAMAKRPQKFIKYAAFPAMMSMLAQSMNDWDEDDVDRLKGSLPSWTRDRSSVFLFPFKDSNGRPQFADYSYALPWSPFVDAGLKIHNHFEAESIGSAVNSTLALGQDVGDDLGFLGGPLSTMITAWKSNKDSFTGRTIINEGDNPSKKIADMTTWLWNMAMPSFITSHGFLGKLYDDIGIDLPGINPPSPLDSFGKERNTTGQVFGNLSGFQTRGFDPNDSIQQNLKGFNRRLQEVNKSRSAFLKNRNKISPQDRASTLREFNKRRKLLIQERTDFLNRARG